ncbi:response regulator [Nitrospina gracilis]|uniref:response regulator n=1 Tax=Nitrospina gracilis TaxID=35801 RepID=UPI001F0171BF|nr:HD domain-containing phosphohydrolase [Nitrospina gracilis]
MVDFQKFDRTNKRILLVDDTPSNLAVLRGALEPEGYRLAFASSGNETLEIVPELFPDLILLDVMMPGIDGFETCRRLKATEVGLGIPVIFITARRETQDVVEGFQAGGVDYIRKPIQQEEVCARVRNHLELLHLRRSLKQQYEKTREVLEETLNGSVSILMELLTNFDSNLFSRGTRVREVVREIADVLEYEEIWQLELAAMLAPIGNITIPPHILYKRNKKAPLSVREEELFRSIPKTSMKLLENIPHLKDVSKIVLYHKKGYDGSGYPPGTLEGKSIPLGSRILNLVFDLVELESMGLTRMQALEKMKERKGRYDLDLMRELYGYFQNQVQEEEKKRLKSVTLEGLKVGHVIAKRVDSVDGTLLLSPGQIITQAKLLLLKNHHLITGIKEPIQVMAEE